MTQSLEPYIQGLVDGGIDAFEIIQGEILNKLLKLQDNEPKCCTTCFAAWNTEQDLLTELRVLGYNVVFAIADKEKLNEQR